MSRLFVLSVLGFLLGAVLLTAQGTNSGPKEGALLPKPFSCYTFNGAHKGKFHCLVCDYALSPVVLVFARVSEKDKDRDAALNALLKRLDDATNEFKKHQLRAAVVFLSEDAQSSATNPAETDPKKLVEEAKNRRTLGVF